VIIAIRRTILIRQINARKVPGTIKGRLFYLHGRKGKIPLPACKILTNMVKSTFNTYYLKKKNAGFNY
jgi:hypothetical protein